MGNTQGDRKLINPPSMAMNMAGKRPASMISIPNIIQHIWYPTPHVTGPFSHILVVACWTVPPVDPIPKPMTDETETLDALGLLCPLPVLKARKRLKSMPAGSILRVLADDPAAIVDVPHFCAEAGHILLSQEQESDHQVYVILKSS